VRHFNQRITGCRSQSHPVFQSSAAKTCRAFLPWRSTAINTLESRISPMKAVKRFVVAFDSRGPRPWRSLRPQSPLNLQGATRCILKGYGALVRAGKEPPGGREPFSMTTSAPARTWRAESPRWWWRLRFQRCGLHVCSCANYTPVRTSDKEGWWLREAWRQPVGAAWSDQGTGISPSPPSFVCAGMVGV